MAEHTLTDEELAFLKRHKLSSADVFIKIGGNNDYKKNEAKKNNQLLFVGSACNNGGHRLRVRAGHCAVCDPRRIAYNRRHRDDGYVYIMGSFSTGMFKIGSSKDAFRREADNVRDSYGSVDDWELLFYAKVSERGRVEHAALTNLSHYKVRGRTYEKDGELQKADELLRCSFKTVFVSLANILEKEGSREDLWLSPRHKVYP